MKTLYLTRNTNILIDDASNNSMTTLRDIWPRINNVYLIKEDCHVIFGGYEESKTKEFDVKKDDVILTFYSDSKYTPHSVIVVNNKELSENLAYIENDQYSNKKNEDDEEGNKKGI